MNGPFETGSLTVDRMSRLQISGNVIPVSWYNPQTNGETEFKCNHYTGGHCVLVSSGRNQR